MRQVHFLEGQTGEMSDRDFWVLLGNVTGDLMVKTCYSLQIGGFPDVSGGLKSWNQRGRQLLEILIPQIEDDELRELLHTHDLQTQ